MSSIRLLLADDNPEVLETLCDLLQPAYDIVGAFSDGASVLQQIGALKPDLIILDISLGDMTGFEVARRLKKSGMPCEDYFPDSPRKYRFHPRCLRSRRLRLRFQVPHQFGSGGGHQPCLRRRALQFGRITLGAVGVMCSRASCQWPGSLGVSLRTLVSFPVRYFAGQKSLATQI